MLHFRRETLRAKNAWVIMPNHVHTLFTMLGEHELGDLVHSWKSFTANQIHTCIQERGKLWQRDYFDRLIRDKAHFKNCVRYIRKNPFRAKLGTKEYLLHDSPWMAGCVH